MYKNRLGFLSLTTIILLMLIGFISLEIYFYKSTDFKTMKEQRKNNFKEYPKDATIKIGVIWPFFLEEGDNYFKEGILLAQEEINKKKVLGREIELIFKDDQWDKDEAFDIAYDFANNKDIIAVIAHDDSELAIPTSLIYEYSNIIMLSPAVSDPMFTRTNFDYIFRNTPSDFDIGNRLASLSAQMSIKKVIILNSTNSYSRQLSQIYKKEMINLGSKVVYTAEFKDEQHDFKKILTDISPKINMNIDYDAIFIAGYEDNLLDLIRGIREYGISSPILTGDTLDGMAVLTGEEAMDGVIVASIYNSKLLNEKEQDFIDRFQAKYNILPDTWAGQGYDALYLLAEAIENTKELNSLKIAHYIKYLKDYSSIFGKYSFNTKGDIEGREIFFKIVKNGHFEYLYFK